MYRHSSKRFLLVLLLTAVLMTAAACASSPAPSPTATPAVTAEPTTEESPAEAPSDEPALEWPNDEGIAYCPPFTEGTIIKVTKQDETQRKNYIISYDGVEQEAYDAYAKALEEDPTITVVTNFNTRNISYSFHAHKADDDAFAIKMNYTVSTKKLQITVAYAK